MNETERLEELLNTVRTINQKIDAATSAMNRLSANPYNEGYVKGLTDGLNLAKGLVTPLPADKKEEA